MGQREHRREADEWRLEAVRCAWSDTDLNVNSQRGSYRVDRQEVAPVVQTVSRVC